MLSFKRKKKTNTNGQRVINENRGGGEEVASSSFWLIILCYDKSVVVPDVLTFGVCAAEGGRGSSGGDWRSCVTAY